MDDPLRNEEAGLPPEQSQRRTAPSFIFLMLIIFLLTNNNGDEFLARHQYQHALESLEWQLANYTLWMNGAEANFTLVRVNMSTEVYQGVINGFRKAETPN